MGVRYHGQGYQKRQVADNPGNRGADVTSPGKTLSKIALFRCQYRDQHADAEGHQCPSASGQCRHRLNTWPMTMTLISVCRYSPLDWQRVYSSCDERTKGVLLGLECDAMKSASRQTRVAHR
ncbi:hypothetical protein ACVXG8_00605 [Escherichia coli]